VIEFLSRRPVHLVGGRECFEQEVIALLCWAVGIVASVSRNPAVHYHSLTGKILLAPTGAGTFAVSTDCTVQKNRFINFGSQEKRRDRLVLGYHRVLLSVGMRRSR